MPTVHLADRGFVSVTGADAEHFLQNLITTDLGALGGGEARPSALLTPQGKVLFDFLIARAPDGFLLECAGDVAADLAKRLTIYKVRAKVAIDVQEQGVVAVSWGDDSGPSSDTALRDMRFFREVRRERQALPAASATPDDWTALRIAEGVAESGSDYALSDAFPHDLLYDFNGGVGLRKGCFVGQEVVSRMQHRGTARRRVMIVDAERDLPASGTPVTVAGRPIGALGSTVGGRGLAILRIDKVRAALDASSPIEADGVPLTASIPAFAGYSLPEPDSAD